MSEVLAQLEKKGGGKNDSVGYCTSATMNLGYKPRAVAIRYRHGGSFSLYIVYNEDDSNSTYSVLAFIPNNNANTRDSAVPLGNSFSHWGSSSSFNITENGFSLGGTLGQNYNNVNYIAVK